MRILYAPALAELTTIRLGGRAIAMLRLETEADLDQLGPTLDKLGGTPFALGRGSNLLAQDAALPLVLVRPGFGGTPRLAGAGPDGRTLVRVGAECSLPRLLAFAGARGLSGLEGLSGIPGEVGGALRMNAGSYGVSFCDNVVSALVYAPRQGLRILRREDMTPAYRHTALPGDEETQIILDATLALRPAEPASVRAAMREILCRKAASQPVRAWSAGCAFTNPAGQSAGKLLDQLGFKGKSRGGMAFSAQHANFLINTGAGTAAQAFELLEEAREAVRLAFALELRLEVKVLTC